MIKKETLIIGLLVLAILIPLNIFMASKYLTSYYAHLLFFQLTILLFIFSGVNLSKQNTSEIIINKWIFYSAIFSTVLQVLFYICISYQILTVSYRSLISVGYVILFLFIFPKNLSILKKEWRILNTKSRILNLILLLLNAPFYILTLIVFYYLLSDFN